MTQKCKIDNEESDDDKLLSGRHDLGLSGSGTPKEIPIAAYSRRKAQYEYIDRQN